MLLRFVILIVLTFGIGAKMLWGQCLVDTDFASPASSCGGSVDYVSNTAPVWGLDETAVSGSNYLGMHPQLASMAGQNSTIPSEYISIPLSSPLVVGNTYDLSFYFAIGQLNGLAFFSIWSAQNLGNNAGYFKAWLGYSNCDTAYHLHSTAILPNESVGWQLSSNMFTAPAPYTHLILAPVGIAPGNLTPYMLLDWVTLCETTILSTELESFNAQKQGRQNQLKWTTITESNSSHFDIYRSEDGINYGLIGEQKASGNTLVPLEYEFTDNVPIGSISYYKLTYFDKDGKTQVFGPISILNETEYPFYPNPVEEIVNIENPSDKQKSYQVFDMSGRMVNSGMLSPGLNTINLDFLQADQYIIQIGDEHFQLVKI